MPAFALRVEYDGAPFIGWQRQATGLSVQQVIEDAAAHLNGGEPPTATAAGRTDAGVHAEAQVVLIDISAELTPDRVRDALNFHARPHPVVVLAAVPAAPGWSPRFDAIGRAYRYRILNRRSRPALDLGRVWHVPRRLDAAAMHDAAQALLGRHDFSAYRAASCQANSPLRTLDRLDVARLADDIVIIAEARSFLHHQVRNLVGTLAEVGMGRRPTTWPRAVLDSRDRARAGQTAPPEGLTLTSVRYDPAIDWG
ncbi:tRNA pseudouridine(38-40) synthase TruA [Roseomonas sp. CECT 9278]|uniref:tRNA pseudouridine(38-40) synthase TruA n=1 Tax=Roseomonas sp. CECT 9278 TaxID=2845823 RepID=UPI001E45FE1B|nr:tRNA pseudouridine(38-40) synthase TruA [Roseomonas sp. CECT 9278]CAH0148917.1 tRNA pseudouridine synthase A [Roseomonas sp. CECT 9278]